MKKIAFRDLRPEEIEVRVGNIIKDKNGQPKGFQLLLYKTSRTDMQLLDETFGTFGWRNRFYQVKNTMVCSIEVYDEETKQWINKDNGGDDDTAMEQVKSELSDSIKRAGSTLGIGRKLYSASKIYMVVDISEENTTRSYFQVKDIAYDDKGITKLVIINKKTKKVVISYGSDEKVAQSGEKPQETALNEPKGSIDKKDLEDINKFLEITSDQSRTNFYTWLDREFGTMTPSSLTLSQGKRTVAKIMGRKQQWN